jgi:hypothetical protein
MGCLVPGDERDLAACGLACLGVPLDVAALGGYDTSDTRLRHLAAIRAYRQVQPYDRYTGTTDERIAMYAG